VIFDWGGTLTPWHPIDPHEQWLAYARVYDAHGAQELAARLRVAEDAAWAAARDHHHSTSLATILASAGVRPEGALHEEALVAFESGWESHTFTDPEAVPLLVALRERGLRIGILSNTVWERGHHERVFARDGVLDLVDGAVYSSEISWTKPHPEAFLAAAAAVGVSDPARVAFVGDRPFDDIHGASAVGMRTILVPHSDIPVEQRGHTEGEPDAVAHRLSDVLAIVDGWLSRSAR